MPSRNLTCIGCGNLMHSGPTSLPQGQAMCHACRRKTPEYQERAAKLAKAKSFVPELRWCPTCGSEFETRVTHHKYCRPECRPYGWHQHQSSPKYRTAEHRRERAAWVKAMDANGYLECAQSVCLMSSRLIQADDKWHLGHDDTGTRYIGPVHAKCNVTDGARRGNRRSHGESRWAL